MTERGRLISDKTGVTIGMFAVMSAALVMVGVYIQKVDTLVKQMSVVQNDLTAIRVRLGIPPSRETVAAMEVREGKVIALPDAIAWPQTLRRQTPRRAATSVPE